MLLDTVQYCVMLKFSCELLLGGSEYGLSSYTNVCYQVQEATQPFLPACFAVDSSESHTS